MSQELRGGRKTLLPQGENMKTVDKITFEPKFEGRQL
jgi:hypothetical protein